MSSYRVVVADDSERARQAVRLILEGAADFTVVGEAASGPEAVRLARELQPDLVLMDIHMPGFDGLEATRTIKRDMPQVRIVILSVSDTAADLFEAIRCGAQGYLVKSLQPSDWISYLRGVMDDRAAVPADVAARLVAEFKSQPAPAAGGSAPVAAVAKLTPRERDILRLVGAGLSNREIGQRLFISENTVKNHLKHIMAKLQLQNRVQLAARARDVLG
ncbi:MAG: response regulator transcription factor [Alicyclobacillaceae bacterium]|nr:response regulator transcription factor [Alicyclobacillaceae bacterium]